MRAADRAATPSHPATGSAGARAARLFAAFLYFCFSAFLVAAFVDADNRSLSGRAAAIYVGYLVGQAALLIGLARRLYRQHGLAALRFDIGVLLIVTTMTALPLGTTIAWRRLAPNGTPPSWSLAWWFLAGNLLFSLIPLISCCEALIAWSRRGGR